MAQRILVVEDDLLLKEAVDLILTQAGYAVMTVSWGRDVMNALRRFRPHLVLLDIRLPDIDGLKVLQMIRKDGHRDPVIMMTANSSADVVRDVMALGGNGYLLKPFEPSALVSRVRSVLDQPPRRDLALPR